MENTDCICGDPRGRGFHDCAYELFIQLEELQEKYERLHAMTEGDTRTIYHEAAVYREALIKIRDRTRQNRPHEGAAERAHHIARRALDEIWGDS